MNVYTPTYTEINTLGACNMSNINTEWDLTIAWCKFLLDKLTDENLTRASHYIDGLLDEQKQKEAKILSFPDRKAADKENGGSRTSRKRQR